MCLSVYCSGSSTAALKSMERSLQSSMAGKKRTSVFSDRFVGEAGVVLCRDEKWRRCQIVSLLAADQLEVSMSLKGMC